MPNQDYQRHFCETCEGVWQSLHVCLWGRFYLQAEFALWICFWECSSAPCSATCEGRCTKLETHATTSTLLKYYMFRTKLETLFCLQDKTRGGEEKSNTICSLSFWSSPSSFWWVSVTSYQDACIMSHISCLMIAGCFERTSVVLAPKSLLLKQH